MLANPHRLAAASALAALILLAAGCHGPAVEGAAEASNGDPRPGAEGGEKDETAVPVEVASLGTGPIQAVIRSTTNLEAERQVKVFSQAARLVRELRVEEGDRVRKGDLLLRLQDEEQRSALAKVQSQHDKTAREYKRQQQLHEKELISDEAFHNATYELEQLRIALDDARRELGYTEVRAPISGTVTTRLVQVGDNLTIGQHLFDLVDFDSIVARIYIPEKDLPRLREGQEARLSAQGSEQGYLTGRVSRISPVVDPQTGTVKVTVALEGGHPWRPGMYVEVGLVTTVHPVALLVPKRALVYDKDQIFIYRLEEERRVKRILLQPVLEDKENVEPAGGLDIGDQVVVAGQAGLKDGALVRLPDDPEPEAAGTPAGGGDAAEAR